MEIPEDNDKTAAIIKESAPSLSNLKWRDKVNQPASPTGMSDSDNMKPSNLFPDLSTVDWFRDPRFQRYWKHYHQVMNWYQKHVDTYEMLSSKLNSTVPSPSRGTNPSSSRFTPYPSSSRNLVSPKCTNQPSTTWPRWNTMSSSSRRAQVKEEEQDSQSSSSIVTRAETSKGGTPAFAQGSNEDYEMEITDEMVEFFAQSRKHKQERDEAKKLENSDQTQEHIDVEKSGHRKVASTETPKERPGVRRTQEMKSLYGKGAAMIHGMETATQMTFDRNTDLKKPKLWPNMPLKIVFS